MRRGWWAVTLMSALVISGCVEEGGGPEDVLYEYVPAGKADDYRSTRGQEYSLLAIDSVTLSDADMALDPDARQARAEELVQLKFKAISYFLYAYLAQKSAKDSNFEYGGFHTTVRQKTFESFIIAENPDEPGVYDFLFEAEVGGPKNLISEIPLNDDATFDLALPILSNAEIEGETYASQYRKFNPEDHDASTLTSINFEISVQASEPDAYIDYNAMFEDGLLDITIQVGGDYNDDRFDLMTARDVFDRLQDDLGLDAPVATFDALKTDSGPFTGSFDANGRDIQVEVYLYHPDMQKEEGVGFDGLIDIYKDAASKRDIVFYDGHAGYDTSYSGVVVHYNPRHAIAADDFDTLDLPDKYQLFVFNGCKTYTSYADAMYDHPAKSAANLDIITTVNFSWLREMTRVTTDFLDHVMTVQGGTHIPRSYDQILGALNTGRSFDVIYGVHGLSDNPRISPYAESDALCSSCSGNADCPGADNLCLRLIGGEQGCTAACTDDSGCPEGFSCRPAAAEGSTLISRFQCVPTAGRCE